MFGLTATGMIAGDRYTGEGSDEEVEFSSRERLSSLCGLLQWKRLVALPEPGRAMWISNGASTAGCRPRLRRLSDRGGLRRRVQLSRIRKLSGGATGGILAAPQRAPRPGAISSAHSPAGRLPRRMHPSAAAGSTQAGRSPRTGFCYQSPWRAILLPIQEVGRLGGQLQATRWGLGLCWMCRRCGSRG